MPIHGHAQHKVRTPIWQSISVDQFTVGETVRTTCTLNGFIDRARYQVDHEEEDGLSDAPDDPYIVLEVEHCPSTNKTVRRVAYYENFQEVPPIALELDDDGRIAIKVMHDEDLAWSEPRVISLSLPELLDLLKSSNYWPKED